MRRSLRTSCYVVRAAGKVARIRLLGDYAHATRIAFVEFFEAEGALAALNCSGALLGGSVCAAARGVPHT